MYRKMKPYEALNPSTEFSYWIENFLKSRVRAENFAILRDMDDKGELNFTEAEIREALDSLDFAEAHGRS
jgi:hypothetical protein